MIWKLIPHHLQLKLLWSILQSSRSIATCLCWFSWLIRKNTLRSACLICLFRLACYCRLSNITYSLLLMMQAKACSSASIARLKNLNRRTVDVLASRLYFYYSLSYELTGDLSEIRGCVLYLFLTLFCQCFSQLLLVHSARLRPCYLFAVIFLLCTGLLHCAMMSWGRFVSSSCCC